MIFVRYLWLHELGPTRYEKKSNMELGLLGGMVRGKSI